jgi:subtilase-type proteinase RRT12
VDKTVAAGIVVVVAAGNGNKTGAIDACETSPASATSAITVGSIANKTDTKSSDSNFGACVDIYAPGERILSASNKTNTSYIMRSGTSMASPRKC